MEKAKKTTAQASEAKAPASKKQSVLGHGVGRRKSAVARVWLRRGNGIVIVNGKDVKEYFDTALTIADATSPYKAIPQAAKYDVQANVYGGGLCAQAGAVKLGIARALVASEEETRLALRKNNLLTVDARKKERKKYGQKAARRKFQFVKR